MMDKSIRFAGIANILGKFVARKFRIGVTPLLSIEELESNTIKAVLRMSTMEDHEAKLGRDIYTYTQKIEDVNSVGARGLCHVNGVI